MEMILFISINKPTHINASYLSEFLLKINIL